MSEATTQNGALVDNNFDAEKASAPESLGSPSSEEAVEEKSPRQAHGIKVNSHAKTSQWEQWD